MNDSTVPGDDLYTPSFLETMERLESETKKLAGKRIPPHGLPLDEIKEAPEVFQPRELGTDIAGKDAHVRTLVEAIYSESGHKLDPVLVWWSGEDWYVIDGHHRLKAYRKVQQKKDKVKIGRIPATAFDGTLSEALVEAAKRNSKDKLPMSQDDKRNRAWLMVAADRGFSKRNIARATTVSEATVARMRRKLAEIREANPEGWQEDACGMTWKEAQRYGLETPVYDECWEERQAEEVAKRLAKTFGKKMASQPEIFWKGIERYSSRLAAGLEEHLGLVPIHEMEEEPDF